MTAIASDAAPAVGRPPVVLIELLRYFVCSAVALGVDSSLYWVAMQLGVVYRVAAVVGFVGGVGTAYLLSVRWAFQRRSLDNPRFEFLVFLGVGVVGLGVTEALLWLQVDRLHIAPLPAKLIASVGVFAFNFVGRKVLLFVRRPQPTPRIAI